LTDGLYKVAWAFWVMKFETVKNSVARRSGPVLAGLGSVDQIPSAAPPAPSVDGHIPLAGRTKKKFRMAKA
jgi:hypothetical protein